MSDTLTPPVDENQLIIERREKLKAIRQAQADGKGVAFPNDFKPLTMPKRCSRHWMTKRRMSWSP